MTERRWIKWTPLIFAVMGVLLVGYLESTRAEPYTATVDWNDSLTSNGVDYHHVTWQTDGGEHSAYAYIPDGHAGEDTVLVSRDPVTDGFSLDNDPETNIATVDVVDPAIRFVWYGFIVGAALLLGLVTLFSMRGHGYLRGTGEVGSTPELEVAESKGFYWRD